MSEPATAGDRLNLTIVLGLLASLLLAILGMAVTYEQRGAIPGELLQFATMIGSGMVGFLSREQRRPPNTVTTGDVETVNVTPPEAHDDSGSVPAG